MNQNRMMYGFFDELEKQAFIPQALALGARAAPWLLRAGKSAVSAIKPLATKAINFTKANPMAASVVGSTAVGGAQAAASVIRPPKLTQVQATRANAPQPSAMGKIYG